MNIQDLTNNANEVLEILCKVSKQGTSSKATNISDLPELATTFSQLR